MVRAEQLFRLALEDNMAQIKISDLKDCTLAANDAFCQLTGHSKEELLGNSSANVRNLSFEAEH